jgi:hypothetical protein
MEEGRHVDPPAIAAKLEELAELGGVGLTPHAVAVAAVAAVNDTIDKMGSTGELKAFNRAFKRRGGSTRQSDISTVSMPGRRRCWRPWGGRQAGEAASGLLNTSGNLDRF